MIKIRNVSCTISGKSILRDVSLEIKSKGLYCLLGANGAGKSTLLKVLIGVIKEYQGDILVYNKLLESYTIKGLSKMISFVPQKFSPTFEVTVKDILLMGRNPYLRGIQSYGEKEFEKVKNILTFLKIQNLENRIYNSLSGGEAQKISLARALVQDTPIILLDEALSSLDIAAQVEIIRIIKDLSKRKVVILVSHNLNLSSEYSDKLIFMKKGSIVCYGETQKIFRKKTLEYTFGTKFELIKNPKTSKINSLYI